MQTTNPSEGLRAERKTPVGKELYFLQSNPFSKYHIESAVIQKWGKKYFYFIGDNFKYEIADVGIIFFFDKTDAEKRGKDIVMRHDIKKLFSYDSEIDFDKLEQAYNILFKHFI